MKICQQCLFIRTYKLSSPYQDTLVIERRNIKKPINQGLMRRHVPPPSCTLMNIFDGEYHPLFPPAGPRKPTALLFWSKMVSTVKPIFLFLHINETRPLQLLYWGQPLTNVQFWQWFFDMTFSVTCVSSHYSVATCLLRQFSIQFSMAENDQLLLYVY